MFRETYVRFFFFFYLNIQYLMGRGISNTPKWAYYLNYSKVKTEIPKTSKERLKRMFR